MRKSYFFVIFFLALIVLISCDESYVTINQERLVPDKKKFIDDSLLRDSSSHSNYLSYSKPGSHGQELVFKVKDVYKSKKIRIVVCGKFRTNNIYSKSTITTAILSGNENKVLIWKPIFLKYAYKEINKWSWYKDSIDLNETFDGKEYNYINTFAVLGDVYFEKFDVDSLSVTFKYKP
jgi:hypothetical protein